MRVCSRLVRQQDDASGADIEIGGVQVRDVVRREIVCNGQAVVAPPGFDDAGTVVIHSEIGIEGAVGGGEEEIAIVVGGHAAARLPNVASRGFAVQSVIENAHLQKRAAV